MFDEVDESLRALLVSDVPLDPTEVDISFARPAREWSSRLARPTLNLFLFDVRERSDFRDDSVRVTPGANGTAKREHPPRRVDLTYLVTAWTREPEDEHRVLARVLACLYRNRVLAPEHLQGSLKDATLPVLLRCMPPDHLQKSVDFWGVMDNELRAGLTWVATVPLDVFAPVTGPVVLTRELLVGPSAGTERSRSYLVAGVAHRAGDAGTVLPGVHVAVAGTTLRAVTDEAGRFTLAGIPEGARVLQVDAEGSAFTHSITVPSPSYDIPVPAAVTGAEGSRRGSRKEAT
ncbi:MAG: Pvc16 family protein [Tepidiformaceae bacterium]